MPDKPSRKVMDLASDAVAHLGVGPFIKSNLPHIEAKLKEFEEYVENAVSPKKNEGDMTFLALGLPIAHGVLHVGSNRGALARATEWLEREGVEAGPDPTSILAVLIFIYIVNLAAKRSSQQDRELWSRINDRVGPLVIDIDQQTQ